MKNTNTILLAEHGKLLSLINALLEKGFFDMNASKPLSKESVRKTINNSFDTVKSAYLVEESEQE